MGHLSRHEQITLHIKYKETHALLSTHHNHYTSNTRSLMHSYHHTTITFHTMHHDTKALIHRVYCHSPVTICHNYSHYLLTCTAYATCWLTVCLAMSSARGVCILPGSNICNIRLHLAAVQGPECCFLLGWPSRPDQTCVAARTLHLKSCEEQHCFFITAFTPTNQTKS